ncbi:MAG TPA: homocysteine biosynthesis protein [Methanomassiliicoccales archaeon]|mgnify:CR=1 FL=1|nr:homocysteine biosynthesis protein [Methanomassiliicoccales archaeon]HPR98762.1 homocysteine biosynthesis protein [Methanomassiliicoccales archaeon]
MKRTVAEINQRIKDGDVVVMTAEEVISFVQSEGVERAAKEVDVVTTGTFGAMCSSGAFLNFGHSEPPIRMQKVTLNDVPAYGGIAAVDAYIGATELKLDDHSGYGGAHVIEELISGKAVRLKATSDGTDCYPRKDIDTFVSLNTINQAYLFNPRNVYQNYAAGTNSSDRTLYTYMGKLLSNYGNITYSSAGQLSPLLNDPSLRTIGIGTRIFLGGGVGYVAWEGTQFKTNVETQFGAPMGGARNLATIGDMRGMSPEFVRALSLPGYGVSLALGIGIPIPILDEDVLRATAISDEQLFAPLIDYSVQSRNRKPLKHFSYAELRSGRVELFGKEVRTSSLSSYLKARQIAEALSERIESGEFLLTEPVASLPADRSMGTLEVRSKEEAV